MRRFATWLVLLVGLLVIAGAVSDSWPRENRFRIELPADVSVRLVTIEVLELDGESWRTAQLSSSDPPHGWLSYVVSVPPGDYRIRVNYSVRPVGGVDKNHVGDWTTVGSEHQIRLEGGDHRFPPPDHEAQ